MEGIHSTRPIRVRQHLVDMATPGVLLVIIGYGLECCQNSREKGRRRWRGLEFGKAVCITLILTVNKDENNKTQDACRDVSTNTKSHPGRKNVNRDMLFFLLSSPSPLSLTADVLCCSVVTVQIYCRCTKST